MLNTLVGGVFTSATDETCEVLPEMAKLTDRASARGRRPEFILDGRVTSVSEPATRSLISVDLAVRCFMQAGLPAYDSLCDPYCPLAKVRAPECVTASSLTHVLFWCVVLRDAQAPGAGHSRRSCGSLHLQACRSTPISGEGGRGADQRTRTPPTRGGDARAARHGESTHRRISSEIAG